MKGTPINSYAPDFELPGVDNQVHHLARYLERYRAVVVLFLSNQSSSVHLYLNRLKQLQQECEPQNVTLVGINPNDAAQSPMESFEQMKSWAQEQVLNFPYIRDVTQDVAASFGAQVTPEAFLLDQEGVLRYRGKIDDSPQTPETVQTECLKLAIAQLLRGEVIDPTVTEPVGQPIQWR
ncbi:MAG: thioredoxin family protein [Microcoleaceae cyanobacterium]